jgi:uncharacterized protein (DUF885 family)
VNYDIFKRQIDEGIRSFDFADYEMPINADSGFPPASRGSRKTCRSHGQGPGNYISRLKAWPRYVREQIALMRLGLKSGMTVSPDARAATTRCGARRRRSDKSVLGTVREVSQCVPAADQEALRNEGATRS